MMDFDVANTRLEKQMQRKDYEKEYLTRNKIYGDEMITETDTTNKSNLIFKLKKILSKKYNLTDQEYIIVIDKFKLNSSNLNKETLVQLISYLNEQNKYRQLDDTYVQEPIKSKSNSTMNEPINNIMDALVNNNKKLIMEKDNIKIDITPIRVEGLKKKKKKKKKKAENKVATLEKDFQDRMNNYIEKTKIDEITKPIPIKRAPNTTPNQHPTHHQIMVNLLNNGKKGNQFIVPIKTTYLYKNIQKISIASISICNSILTSYNLNEKTFLLIQIEELLNNFHINNSQKNYFVKFNPPKEGVVCDISYSTTYVPMNIFTLETFSITLFDNQEKPISIMEYDETSDFINIVFDIYCS